MREERRIVEREREREREMEMEKSVTRMLMEATTSSSLFQHVEIACKHVPETVHSLRKTINYRNTLGHHGKSCYPPIQLSCGARDFPPLSQPARGNNDGVDVTWSLPMKATLASLRFDVQFRHSTDK